jgi:hypothetical protein
VVRHLLARYRIVWAVASGRPGGGAPGRDVAARHLVDEGVKAFDGGTSAKRCVAGVGRLNPPRARMTKAAI